MLANDALMAAARDARRQAVAAAVRADPRVVFAYLAARVSGGRDDSHGEPCVADALMRMCGFRNRVAHEGPNLDGTVVVRMVESGIEDLARFRDAVSRL